MVRARDEKLVKPRKIERPRTSPFLTVRFEGTGIAFFSLPLAVPMVFWPVFAWGAS